jgi:multisubunit Na+/H+ antiporter MnhF subunit
MKKEWGWYRLLKGRETESRSVALGAINGTIGLLIGTYYSNLVWIFGIFVIVMAMLSFIGVVFVMMKKYAIGAVLMVVSGVVFIPIGVIGIVGGIIAWHHTERYKKKHKKIRRSRMERRKR